MFKFLTADLHFGDERLAILGRPFSNVEEFMENVINNYNKMVSKDDDVLFVGDAVHKDKTKYLPWLSYMNGKKTLIRGNHDKWLTDEELKPYFDVIIQDGSGIEFEVDGIPCYATHYPTSGVINRFNLVGHIHSAWRYQLNMFNVGIDANHFLPINLETIPKHLKAICEYYDEDVWVAYDKINSNYLGVRGKKGRYFQPTTGV